MSFSETISPLLGRCVLVWFYAAGVSDIMNHWHGTLDAMAAKHVPVPALVLLVALVLVVMGCMALLFGWQTRHGAVMLFAVTIIAAVVMHDFWNMAGPERGVEFGIFARDTAIAGGLLLMVGMGPGPFAIDNRGGGKRR